MLRDTLRLTVEAAVAALVREGKIPAAVAEVPVEISDTKSPEHGDYACNLAMVAAKKAGMNPRSLGEMLREELLRQQGTGDRGQGTASDGAINGIQPPTGDNAVGRGVAAFGQNLPNRDVLESVEVAGPGFLNLRLKPEAIAAYVPQVAAAGESYGHLKQVAPQRINVEFVSVNPNGPITIGSGRGAAFGSALANVLQAAGNVVHREYYINDGVNSEQMRQFAESVRSILLNKPLPENAYRGQYVHEVAQQVGMDLHEVPLSNRMFGYKSGEFGYKGSSPGNAYNVRMALLYQGIIDKTKKSSNRYELVESLTTEELQRLSEFAMITHQGLDLAMFGVRFDTWFSEQSLHDEGIVAERIERLKLTGVADEAPYRTKLKMGKGGVVEETIIERQDENANLEEEGAEDEQPAPGGPSPLAPLPQRGEGNVAPHPPIPSPATNHAGEGEDGLSPQPPLQDEPLGEGGRTLWLRSTKFGDDMDRVLRRRDGRLTYIASDVAYHENKLNRPESATKLITILGPDHHGYIGRLTAVMAALLRGSEDTPEANAEALRKAKETLEVVIYQLVRFLKDGKPAPMRKRDGNIYELRDLIDELGKNLVPDGTPEEQRTTGRDVARFFYLMRSHDTTMDFDIDLATQQSDENPVFYAQYAHARICSVLRRAVEGTGNREQGSPTPAPPQGEGIDYSLLVHPRESALIKKILDLPWEVERVAKDYGVHRLTTYAVELARTYHHFYDACRVIQPDQPELTQARLALCQATKTALHATFQLLGVSSPERLERREAAA